MESAAPMELADRPRRQRIVDAMIDSCAAKTYADTTITDVVAGARISRTTFYRHFEDKRQCFDAAVGHCVELLREAVAGADLTGDPPADAIRRGARAVLEAMAARPGLAQVLAVDAVAVDPEAADRNRAAMVGALTELWSGNGQAGKAHLDPHLAFGQAQVLVLNEVALGRASRLPELLPAIVYLAVAPFAGHDEAARQARLTNDGKQGGESSGR